MLRRVASAALGARFDDIEEGLDDVGGSITALQPRLALIESITALQPRLALIEESIGELQRRLAHLDESFIRTVEVGGRFDGVEQSIAELHRRLAHLEHSSDQHAFEVEALRQQVNECRDYLEVQHDAVRDALDVVTPVPGTLSPDMDGG